MSSAGILVTGAGGFIGTRLVNALRDAGSDVLGIDSGDGDITLPETLKGDRFDSIDHVFHLAGRTFVPTSWDQPDTFIRDNVLGTARVLEFCRCHSISLTFVSAYVYGQPQRLPIDEEHPVKPSNPYALSKHLAEQLCTFYAANFDMRVIVCRPFNVYGPGQSSGFFIPSVVSQVLSGSSIVVTDLEPRRDYVYVEDVVTALIRTREDKAATGIFNLGYGRSWSVREVIDIVQTLAGTSLSVDCDHHRRPNELMDVYADTNRARGELGWEPRYSLEEGISLLLEAGVGNHD